MKLFFAIDDAKNVELFIAAILRGRGLRSSSTSLRAFDLLSITSPASEVRAGVGALQHCVQAP